MTLSSPKELKDLINECIKILRAGGNVNEYVTMYYIAKDILPLS